MPKTTREIAEEHFLRMKNSNKKPNTHCFDLWYSKKEVDEIIKKVKK